MCLDECQPIHVNTIRPTHMFIVYVIYACATSLYVDINIESLNLQYFFVYFCGCVYL